jgi:hypothetical protein
MNSKTSEKLWWLSYIVLAIWILSGAVVIFLLLRIDSIIHVQLYHFGLKFSADWAEPYWSDNHLILAFVGFPMVLSALVLGLGALRFKKQGLSFLSKKKNTLAETEPPKAEVNLAPANEQNTLEQKAEAPEMQENAATNTETNVVLDVTPEQKMLENDVTQKNNTKENNAQALTCPSCKRTINKPLIKLDFSSTKIRLVNICPYCSTIIAEVKNKKNGNGGNSKPKSTTTQ